jgi:hypothetical protein
MPPGPRPRGRLSHLTWGQPRGWTASPLSPCAEKLYPVLHHFGREVCNQVQQAAQVLTHRILLLPGENDAGVCFVLRNVVGMEIVMWRYAAKPAALPAALPRRLLQQCPLRFLLD